MGRIDEAREILGRLRSEDGNVETLQAQHEYEDIVANVALEKKRRRPTPSQLLFILWSARFRTV